MRWARTANRRGIDGAVPVDGASAQDLAGRGSARVVEPVINDQGTGRFVESAAYMRQYTRG